MRETAARRADRSSQLARAMSAGPEMSVRVLAGPNVPLEVRLQDLQRRVRDVHRSARLGGDAYHAEMDAIATEIGRVKLELRGWARRDTTTWRAAPKGQG